mmetsp:Transcript_57570/g.166599  ORF Transcript_57570/g.166599 Transcript_57570/m.166599 type:complete len:596 (-) Transcript_57570:87-1874(-)
MGLAMSRPSVRSMCLALLAALSTAAALRAALRGPEDAEDCSGDFARQKGVRGGAPSTPLPPGVPPPPSRAPPGVKGPGAAPGSGQRPPMPSRRPPGASEANGAAMPPMPSRAPPGAPPASPPPMQTRPPPGAIAPGSQEVPQRSDQVAKSLEWQWKEGDVEFWVALDFEWTCDEGQDRRVHSEQAEIIEFSFVIFDVRRSKMVTEGQYYVKPRKTPITEFCVELTGITDEKLKDAGSLEDAIAAFNRAWEEAGAVGKPAFSVAHGSADLELILPRNCKDLGLEVPWVMRRYVDLREATQTHLATLGNTTATSLRQICDALKVEMIGEEHCGLDDSWMVLMATQQLHKLRANLVPIDLEAERAAFLADDHPDTALVLDGLPYHGLGSEIREWIIEQTGNRLPESAFWIVLGNDGRPTGRAFVDFGSHAAAVEAYLKMDGGRRLISGSKNRWAYEAPRERLVLARPPRRQELSLPRRDAVVKGNTSGVSPALAPFPVDAAALEVLKRRGRRQAVEPAENCTGRVKLFYQDRGYGFITYDDGEASVEVFMHINNVEGGWPLEGDEVLFNVVIEKTNNKTRADRVRILRLLEGFDTSRG